eukprot:361837-Chlamydomonas_euryale.AAC.4
MSWGTVSAPEWQLSQPGIRGARHCDFQQHLAAISMAISNCHDMQRSLLFEWARRRVSFLIREFYKPVLMTSIVTNACLPMTTQMALLGTNKYTMFKQ